MGLLTFHLFVQISTKLLPNESKQRKITTLVRDSFIYLYGFQQNCFPMKVGKEKFLHGFAIPSFICTNTKAPPPGELSA